MKVPFTLVSDAADILNIGERQVQRLIAQKQLGRARRPTKAECAMYGLARHQLIIDGDRVHQLKVKRENVLVDRRIRRNNEEIVRKDQARRAARKRGAGK